MNHDAQIDRRQWASMLGSVCSPSFPADAVEAITDMLPLLAEWGPEFFTVRTVQEIGTAKRRQSCPSLDEITAAFAKQRLNAIPTAVRMGASHLPALPAPATREPTQSEADYVAARVAEAKAILAEAGAKCDIATGRGAESVKARHLSPAHLEAVRANNPSVQAARRAQDARAAQ